MQRKVNLFFQKVYLWMFLGLLISGLASLLVISFEGLQLFLFGNAFVIILLFIIEIILVIVISRGRKGMSSEKARGLFFVYSFINGLTLSSIFFIYTAISLVYVFVIAAAMFLAMAVYGLTTKKDLSKRGPILFGALIGLIVMMIINIFVSSSGFNLIIGVLGVVIFAGLTMYDNKMLSKMAMNVGSKEGLDRLAVVGALSLYLDFINLFLSLLRIFGERS